ncbi:MAG TPA: hypothetical protein VIV06_07835, partial [Candidatus Limnocylindrales bacterium]
MTGWTPDPRDLGEQGAGLEAVESLLARRARYSRWDGRQSVPDLDAEEILEALSDDLMTEGDLAAALRRLMDRGWQSGDPTRQDMPGLSEVLERLHRRRDELLEQYRLGDVLADIRAELEGIVAEERAGIRRRLDEAAGGDREGQPGSPAAQPEGEPTPAAGTPAAGTPGAGTPRADPALRRMLRAAAARRLDQLDALPSDVGDQIRALEEYDFLEPGARERFQALVERLRRQVLDQFVNGLSDAIKGVTPEDLAANREMIRDLNKLLAEKLAGGDPDASDLLARHGRFFPGATTLDDIVEQLADRMAAMQSLLQSMSPEQRAELQSTMDALLRDDRLRWDLAQLAANIDQLLPGGLGERYRFRGSEPLGLDSALRQMAELQRLEGLQESLENVEAPGDLSRIDRQGVRDLLGDEAARDLGALDQLTERLERAGYLRRQGDRLELTPRGTRRIGQKVLDDLFSRLRKDAFGGHRIERPGRGGERDETSKPYEFGDQFHLDLPRTLANALVREENEPGRRPGRALSLAPSDFEVFRTEETTRT